MTDTNREALELGNEILNEFRALADALEAGERVDTLYTIRTIELNLHPQAYTPESVKATRSRLRASQSVFAHLMASSVATIQSWEQGVQVPPPMACRLMDLMNSDTERWLELLRRSAKENGKQEHLAPD
jgi:DNA-binding transcriptional regulator YiaG